MIRDNNPEAACKTCPGNYFNHHKNCPEHRDNAEKRRQENEEMFKQYLILERIRANGLDIRGL
jgi:hypothetical protein